MKIGIEVEGRWRGLTTLLVANQELDKVMTALANSPKVNMVYIGALGTSDGTHGYIGSILALIDDIPNMPVTIEIDIQKASCVPVAVWNNPKVRVVLSIKLPSDLDPLLEKSEVKIDTTSRAYVYGDPQVIDTTYAYDRPAL